MNITNAHGKEIDLESAFTLMDQDILYSLDHGSGRSHQEFFDAYCERHMEKFGEEFEPNKRNPVW